jgi:hypothetical protein
VCPDQSPYLTRGGGVAEHPLTDAEVGEPVFAAMTVRPNQSPYLTRAVA